MFKHLRFSFCFFLWISGSLIHLAAQPGHTVQFTKISLQEQWDSILRISSETGMPVFVTIHADWCKYCRLMEAEVYGDRQVADYFNQFYLNVVMDGEKDFGKIYAQRQAVQGFPTLLFVNGKGGILQRVNGYVEASRLLTYGRRAFRKSDFIPVIEAKYHEKRISHEEMLIYLDYIETSDYLKAIAMAGEYLDALGTETYSDSVVFRMISKYALDPGRATPQRILGMWSEMQDVYGEEAMEEYFAGMFSHHLKEAIIHESDSMVKMLFPLLQMRFGNDELRDGILGTWKIFYAETGNISGYNSVIMDEFSRSADPYEFLYNEAYELAMDYASFEDFPAMANAWMDTLATIRKHDFDAAYLHAYIKVMIPDYTAAEKLVVQCKSMAKTKKEQELVQQLLQFIEQEKSFVPAGDE
jgi:thioredoxin-related protein